MTPEDLKPLIRTIPDFPQPGILFRDITTLIGHGEGFAASVNMLAARAQVAGAQSIAGMEARGFIFGAAVAARLGLPFVPVRKPGKLPVPVRRSTMRSNMARTRWRSIPMRLKMGSASSSSTI